MTKFQEAVIKMVQDKFEQGKPNEIRGEIKKLAKQFKTGKEGLEIARKLLKLEQDKLQDAFIEKFTEKFVSEEFDKLSEKFADGVIAAARGVMNGNMTTDVALKKIKRASIIANKTNSNTIRTAKGGLVEAQKFSDAKQAGLNYFRYVGPETGSRQFCSNHVGKVFSEAEIDQMQAMPGLPVKYFGGGWNCRHRWVAVAGLLETALEHQKRDLPYSERDIAQDVRKHAPDLGLDKEGYIKEAQEVVRNSKEIFGHRYYSKEYQFEYLSEKGNVVVDFKGNIRGYFLYILGKEGDIDYNLNKGKNTWKRLN